MCARWLGRCSILLIFTLVTTPFGVPSGRAAELEQKVARLGFVDPGSPATALHGVDEFWRRLRELGWIKDENLIVEERWAEGRPDRLAPLMQEVLARKVDVLFTYTTPAAIAAKKATSTTPIVDGLMGDPIDTGLAASLAHPGGNLTGLSMGWSEGIADKWLELLKEMVPRMSTVAVIVDPDRPMSREQAKRLQVVAPTHHLKVQIIAVRGPGALDRAFGQTARTAQAVLVLDDPNLSAQRQRVVTLAARHRLPDMQVMREYVDAGALMAYAPDVPAMFRRAADYVDKILNGTKPADLPIEEPTKYVLIVNLKTAKALGVTIPESILLRADEVIR
jgi:putative tryptophan/tyrosine transport system substrate-binding protein